MKVFAWYSAVFMLVAPINAQWQELAPGLLYTHEKTSEQSIYILKARLAACALALGAYDAYVAKAQKTSTFAQQKGAAAAINAGFFDMVTENKLALFMFFLFDRLGLYHYKVWPHFEMKKDGQWWSLSTEETGAIGWNNDGTVLFDVIKTPVTLTIGERAWPVDALNSPVTQGAILYSSVYGQKTPVRSNCTEIIIDADQCVASIVEANGGTMIPQGGYVYAFHGDAQGIKKGMPAEVNVRVVNADGAPLTLWNEMPHILGSTPLLMKDGQVIASLCEKMSAFYAQRHPRTAVGMHEDGDLLFITVDGRQKQAQGFTMLELAAYMQQLGATDALNLDGGGSTTMVIGDEVVNEPSGHSFDIGRYERSVANVLLLVPNN